MRYFHGTMRLCKYQYGNGVYFHENWYKNKPLQTMCKEQERQFQLYLILTELCQFVVFSMAIMLKLWKIFSCMETGLVFGEGWERMGDSGGRLFLLQKISSYELWSIDPEHDWKENCICNTYLLKARTPQIMQCNIKMLFKYGYNVIF